VRETIMGGSGPTSPTITHLKELNAFAGTKFKPISGFKGSSEVNLAMERGEVHGATKSWAGMKSSNRDWLDGKRVSILVQYAMERAPDLPDVPAMVELGRDDSARKALRFLAVGNEMGRTVFAPPGLAADTTKTLRTAFDAMMASRALKDDADKRKLELGALKGEGLEKLVDETLAIPADILKSVKATR
jgi:tripartite-type tricarboxylate transporter receptor subunit TctC